MEKNNQFQELKSLIVRCEEWPSGLVDANEIAEMCGIPPERILALSDAGYWPHYRFDGGVPQYRKVESKSWAARNLMHRIEGKDADFNFNVIIQTPTKLKNIPPVSISNIKGLTELTHVLYPPGVYFLVNEDEVVYVGQSTNPLSRLGTHVKEKRGKFDRVYFLPVPEFMLDAVERGFIELLSPVLNGNPGPRADGMKELAKQIYPDLFKTND